MAENKLPNVSKADAEHLMAFIRNSVKKSGAEGAVIGLSGGLDSAVVTKLAADAIGPENILNVFMPFRATSPKDYKITSDLSDEWGTEYRIIDVQPVVDSLSAVLQSEEDDAMERGNTSARCRMIVLYNLARKRNYLVMGTSNQSELMTGYFTKFGDGACDITPLANMYKTNVKQLAKMIGVPDEIIQRPPSAGFWEDQTDEEEMGISYDMLDLILYNFESDASVKDIAQTLGIPCETVKSIKNQVKRTEHKRNLPLRPGTLFE